MFSSLIANFDSDFIFNLFFKVLVCLYFKSLNLLIDFHNSKMDHLNPIYRVFHSSFFPPI